MTTDLDRTLAALTAKPWTAVLCWPASKKPAARRDEPWPVTRDVDRVRHHVEVDRGNLGLVAGPTTGVTIVDPDKLQEWQALIRHLGPPPRAWVRTGSGREHFYTAWEPRLPAKLVSIDGELIGEIQRGPGLQHALLPPAVHPRTRRRYTWLVDPASEPLIPLPEPWRRWLRPSRVARRSPSRWLPPVVAADYSSRLAAALAQPGACRRISGLVKFRCPACAALGADQEGDNAALFPDGRFGCAPVTGTRYATFHRRAIARALGLSTSNG